MRYLLFIISFIAVSAVSQVPVSIPEIQRAALGSDIANQHVVTKGIVTAVIYGENDITGFFLQDTTVSKIPNTSNGIFVYSGNVKTVSVGDEIEVNATLHGDYSGIKVQNPADIKLISRNNTVTPIKIKYGPENPSLHPYVGKLVEFDQTLWVNNNYYLEQYGELELGHRRKPIPTNIFFPATTAYNALVSENSLPSIILDDGYSTSYRVPIVFADENGTRRLGERVDNLQGVLNYTNGRYVIIPSQVPVHFYGNPRKRKHADIGNYNLKVCGFNLEYYLTSPNSTSMGPRNITEMNRQHEKIVDALYEIDADVYGLVEIEQGQAALTKLANALNTKTGTNRYAYINDGTSISGTFTKVAYLYRTDKVTPYKSLININSPSPYNRKKLQAFTLSSNNERFILSVNHFKAKSGCDKAYGNDVDQGDGQGCYNATRVAEAGSVISHIISAKATYGDDDVLVIGDLNAYAKEDPIKKFLEAGYVDLHRKFHGDSAYSYVYYDRTKNSNEAGYLDHAIANESMTRQITGVTPFHINADELRTFGYSGAKYNVGMFRSSDHDPIIVGIALGQSGSGGISDSKPKVYPTVVSDVLNVEVEDNSVLQIFSLSGVCLYNKEIVGQTINIKEIGLEKDGISIQPGAYILRVLYEGKIHQQIIFVK